MVAVVERIRTKAKDSEEAMTRLQEFLKKTPNLVSNLRKAAGVTGLCTFPDIRDYVKRVVDRMVLPVDNPLPKDPVPAINADYYPYNENGNAAEDDEIRRNIKEMRDSIGDDETFNAWLRQHEDWRHVFAM